MQKHDSGKKDFTFVYEHATPYYYYKEFLVNLGMVEREEILAKYIEYNLLDKFRSWVEQLGKPLSVLDFLGCFGNTTLAITNNFYSDDYSKMWSCDNCCYKSPKPRQFECTTWACDISQNACEYGKKAGIYDEFDVFNLNKISQKERNYLQTKCQNANIIHINSLGYLEDHVPKDIIDWFAEGKEPGVLIVGFAYPYNGVERMQEWKKYGMSKLKFFSSVPSASRKLYESESTCFGSKYGTWSHSYYEVWFFMR